MQKKSIRKSMFNSILIATSLLGVVTPTFASGIQGDTDGDGKLGIVNLYKMENVKADGTGDYLLEIKLEKGWKPYADTQISLGQGSLCTSYDKGYTDFTGKNNHVLEDVTGAILEDINNSGTRFRGKVTNPTNGIIEVPLNLCEEHERGILVKQAYMDISIKGSKDYYANGSVHFKDAKPISQRGETPPTQPDKVYKEDVSFTIGKETFTVTTKTGEKITKNMQKGEAPYMSNGRTMLPVRYASEALNASVEWNPSKREVIVKKGSTTVRLPLNSQYAMYSDGTKVDMGAKTTQVNGRTYVPVGALGNILNATMTWDEVTQTVIFVN